MRLILLSFAFQLMVVFPFLNRARGNRGRRHSRR